MNLKENPNRVYHPYWRWECYKYGFYNACSGKEKEEKILKVLEMFNSKQLTKEYMDKVLELWQYSCEHNLTNPSINKIAFIGQAACCIYAKVPATITMEAWSLLDKKTQERSNKLAQKVINKFSKQNIQLCLNID